MSATAPERELVQGLPLDERRGSMAMGFFITTEATLFAVFFFAYYYLGAGRPRWPMDAPPRLVKAFIMLGLLAVCSAVLYYGEEALKKGRSSVARATAFISALIGLGFLVVQALEYVEHLKELPANKDAYSSIFYTITSFHAAHLAMGICMLAYVTVLPNIEATDKPPHRAFHNASMYMHFVDLVWLVIVLLLYVSAQ